MTHVYTETLCLGRWTRVRAHAWVCECGRHGVTPFDHAPVKPVIERHADPLMRSAIMKKG